MEVEEVRAWGGSIHLGPGHQHLHHDRSEQGIMWDWGFAVGITEKGINFPVLSINIWNSTWKVLTHLDENECAKISHSQRQNTGENCDWWENLSRSTWCILVVCCLDHYCLLVIVTLQSGAHQWGMTSRAGNKDKVLFMFTPCMSILKPHISSPMPCFSGHEKTHFNKQEVEMVEKIQNTWTNPLLVHSAKMLVPRCSSCHPVVFHRS